MDTRYPASWQTTSKMTSYLKKGGTPQKRWPTSKKGTHLKKGNPSPKKATHPHQKWQPKRGSETDNRVLGVVACIVVG
jgi:hypothetical protein